MNERARLTPAQRRILRAIADHEEEEVVVGRPRNNFWKVGPLRGDGPVASWEAFKALEDAGLITLTRRFAGGLYTEATAAGREEAQP